MEERAPAAYEPPRVTTLGTAEELTMGGSSPSGDTSALGFLSFSDRRLKHRVAAVDRRAVLERVEALPLRSTPC